MFENTHTEISGTFVRICSPEQIDLVLNRNSSERPQARYNRPGEDALYLAVNEVSARVAMRKYVKDITTPLVLITYEVEPCRLVDLRHESMSEYKALAGQNWQDALAKCTEPSSWQVSDLLRKNQEIGLIDPSRKDPETWHVTLFLWKLCRTRFEVGVKRTRLVKDVYEESGNPVMTKQYKGSCLCGEVQFSVSGFNEKAANCHCTMCRKFHGAAFGTLVGVKNLNWLAGEGQLKEFTAANGTIRSFCSNCGSSLGFRVKGVPPNEIELAIATFDDDIPVTIDAQIYTANKANWCELQTDLAAFEAGR